MKTVVLLVALLAPAIHSGMAGPAPQLLPLFPGGSDLDPAVYPLGWAGNGNRLALLIAHPNEAADERNWEILVKDLVSDETVLSETIRHEPADDGVLAFWAAHGATVEALCDKHGVVRSAMELHSFPALLGRYRGEIYEAGLKTVRGEEPNFGYEGIRQLKVVLTKNGSDSKTILDQAWPEWFPLAAGLPGYIPNPDGSRIAVVVALAQRGYEGPPHPRSLLLTGARVGEKF